MIYVTTIAEAMNYDYPDVTINFCIAVVKYRLNLCSCSKLMCMYLCVCMSVCELRAPR